MLSPLYFRNKAAIKGAQEARETAANTELVRSYFKGLNGLSSSTREGWEKQYLNEISGLSDSDKDEVFRNTVFKSLFENSTDPKDKEIWEGRHTMSLADRDVYVARKAIEQDLDGASDYKEQPLNLLGSLFSDEEAEATPKKISAKLRKSLREEATEYLGGVSEDLSSIYRAQVASMGSDERQGLADNFDQMSREFVPNYERYIGTDKLDLTEDEKANLAADYTAWQNVGGDQFAYRMLNKTYQDIIADNQSIWEKTVNTGAQFVDSGAGMIIRAAGMAAGLVGIGRGEQDEDESWWDNILDNSITRYGDRVATTQSWKAAKQEYLEENGMQDNPILNSSKQQNSIVSWNTPFEVLGQYGFTVGSTLLSFGGSGIVEAATKGAGWVGKVATGAKGLNTTAKGIKIARGLTRAKDVGNILVAAGIGGVEGAMNAVGTRDQVLKDLNGDIDAALNKRIDDTIDSYILSNPNEAMMLVAQAGIKLPKDADLDYVASALKSDSGVREYFGKEISPEFDERRAKAKEAAQTAMNVDFIGNSIINGFINTTLQATLNAPSVQRSLRKYGLQKSPIDDLGVDIVKGGDNAWKAAAKRFTKWDAVKNRFKEAWGEGIEEYTQDLSGAFGEGYSKDKMSQYIDFKYGESEGSDAFEEDVYRNFMSGLQYVGEAALSPESIKDGLYGILSTAVGGPNANINSRGSVERQEGESGFAYAKRRSPITWRSSLGPLFNNEADEVNKQRDEVAQRINDFFADKDNQNLFFDLESSTNWMRAANQAERSGDERAIRDAKVAQLVNTIFTANELRGSAYFDAIESNLRARASFNAENLNTPESTESKAVDQYIADTQNRGENISREEALETIIKSAKDMLSVIEKVDREAATTERLFGSEMDRDTKEALVYARVSAANTKERIDAIDKELNAVLTALNERDDTNETSGLGKRSRRVIAQYGSLGEAVKALAKAEEEKAQLDAGIAELEDEIKADENANAAVKNGRVARQSIQGSIQEKRDILRVAKEDAKNRKIEIETAKRDIERYRREAPKEIKVTTNEEGNEVTSEILSGREVLSAKEIMELNPVDRARMLNPKNKNNYSSEQQVEIDKVLAVGSGVLDDFGSKVIDRGKLESSYNGMMRTMLKMSQEPQRFARYQLAVKAKKQRDLLDKKYSYLRDYDNTKSYGEFAEELGRIYSEAPKEDRDAATRVLRGSNSAYYARYQNSAETLGAVYSRLGGNEAFNKLDEGDKNLFTNTLEYLVSKGVDIEDNNAVIAALTAEEENPDAPGSTINSFGRYVEEFNSKADDAEKTNAFTTNGAIQIFKDVMSSMRKEAQEQQANSRPVEVTETSTSDNAPAQTPTPNPAPGIFGSGAYDSPDGGRPEGSDNVEGQPSTTSNTTVEAYRNSSGDLVARAAETALTTINNTPEHAATDKSKAAARARIDKLKDYAFESVEDFADAILKEANVLDMSGEPDNQSVAGVLRRVASTVRNQATKQTKPATTQSQSPLTGLAARRYNYTRQFGTTVNPNSATISTLNLQSQKRNHPNGSLAKFIEKYKIEEFLSDPQALTGERRIVKFIVDSQLAADTKASMESANLPYTVADIPVVPVVEVKEKSDYVIVINDNGTEKYYQPIGVLPATYNTYTSGANRLAKLRDLANSQEQNQLIKDESGNVVSTSIIGHVTATPPAHLQENQSVLHIGMSSLDVNEAADMKDKTKEEARKTPAYQRFKDKFLGHLAVRTNKYGSPELYYSTSNLKNDGNDSGFIITRTPVHRSVDKNSKETIVNLFLQGKITEALAANSRLKRFASEFQDFFNKNTLGANLFVPDGRGGYTLSNEGQKLLDDFAARLGDRLRNYLVLPNKLDGGPVRYTLTPAYEVDANGAQQFKRDANGAPVFLLSASNDLFSIGLTEVSNNTANEQTAFNTLYNLIIDEQGNPRMRSDKESFMVWQIPYKDVQDMDKNAHAKENIFDIYDDGILEASVASFDYSVNSVQFNAPFTVEGQPTYKTATVANEDNASGQKDSAVATTPTGETIDPQSGVSLSGPTVKPELPVSPAVKVAGEIVENSKHIRLSDDGSAYVDDRNGTAYARVTSIIAADREADGERFDPNNPYALPSTNIGTGIDELVRDFFGDNLKDPSSYPNTTKEQVEAFIEQLKGLKNQLAAAGLTVIPRDVVVTGTLNATDSQGKVHQIKVAGTLDLLAYDGEGNFYIFDMKTFRTSIDEHKKEKYARQLSLYKKFLENTYGIKVKSLKIIPIKVDYPKPNQVKYGLVEGKPNQLTANGKEYTGAKPKLHTMIPLNYHEPDINFDSLTASEKEMFKEAVEAQGGALAEAIKDGGTKVTAAPAESPQIDPLTGLPMVGYENPLIPTGGVPEAGKAKSFVVSDLRWGVWAGLTKDEINTLRVQLVKLGYTAEDWDSSDPELRPSDAEKEQAIKCVLGIK